MNTDTMPAKKVHHGRNVRRLRDILEIKQETLAFELNLSQQTISNLEAKEVIDEETLNKIADVLKIPVDAIKNMTDESTINYINTFNEAVTNNNGQPFSYIHGCTFNPIEKIVELYDEKIKLYERMLEMERSKGK